MSELRELYQEVILDHNRSPRNIGRPDKATCAAHGHNPLCGDKITVFLDIKDGIVNEVRFEGSGCAISTASASMMTELIKGKTADDTAALFRNFHHMCTGDGNLEDDDQLADEIEQLQVLSGVREFPMRVKCATLAWHTMKAALDGDENASTE